MNRRILRLAIPSIISNITVPLLGLVDVAIVGHLGAASFIGAIAVGGMLFNMIYWVFGFLRMGTSGLAAQAFGRRDLDEVALVFVRSLGIGILLGLLLAFLQTPILSVAFRLIDTTDEVRRLAALYFHICVWGAPAVLGLYGFAGWFVGMQNSRFPMYIALVQNVVNIVASLYFVFFGKMGVAGVAFGTLIAQYAGFLMAFFLWRLYYGRLWRRVRWLAVCETASMRSFFHLNRDIFLRTLCLVAVTVFFTSQGAREGEIVLAVNTLLMQLFTLFSYVMDGFAYAAEALTGRYIGAGNDSSFRRLVRVLFTWGAGLSATFTFVYAVGGESFLGILTDERTVLVAARDYFAWAVAIPVAGVAAFLWDGIFVGATRSREMLRSMWIASASFFLIYFTFHPLWGNHALWLAFIVYLALRGAVQTLIFFSSTKFNLR